LFSICGFSYISKIYRRKADWIGHVLSRSCLLKHLIAGKTERRNEVTGRKGRRPKQLLTDLKEKERILEIERRNTGCTVWTTRFGRGCGPVVRQTVERMNE
jgi:hypothetical protein